MQKRNHTAPHMVRHLRRIEWVSSPKLEGGVKTVLVFSGSIRVADLHTALLRIVKHRGFDDLSVRQLCVLFAVQHTPGTVRGLAAEMDISKPAISRAADRLEADALLKREDDPADRRSVLLAITAAGKKFLDTVTK